MALPSLNILREIEAMVGDLDVLDARAQVSGEPYADAELSARIFAKRQRTLFELEVANVLAPVPETRTQLVSLNLPLLVGYHDAATALARYLTSPTRARLIPGQMPERLIDASVSLDWFRVPSDYAPAGIAPLDWLALCEHNLRANERAGAGRIFVKLEGAFHQLWFRIEIDSVPRLYRATLA